MMKNRLLKSTINRLGCLFLVMSAGLALPGMAQNLDSLEQVLKTEKLPVDKQYELYEMLALGHTNTDPKRARTFSLGGLKLAEEQNNEKHQGAFLYYLASSYYVDQRYDSASYYFDKTLRQLHKTNYKAGLVSTLKMYAQLYRRQGLYEKALEKYFDAVKIGDQLEHDQVLSEVYTGIGGTYHMLKNYKTALSYYRKAEAIASKHGAKHYLAEIYFSMSNVYQHEKDGKDTALYYANKSIAIARELANVRGIIDGLSALSNVYYQYEDFSSALKFQQEALDLSQTQKNKTLIAECYTDLAAIYYSLEQYEQSAAASIEALKLDSTNHHLNQTLFGNLVPTYARLGQFDLMEDYFDRFKATIEDFSNESYQSSLSEMEVQYETEKKEVTISSLKKQRQLYTWLGIALGLLLLIALAFAIIRYRLAVNRRKLAETEAIKLKREKQLVAIQAALEGEAAERTRLARDLHDGLGGMLSAVKLNLPKLKGDTAVLESVDVSRFHTALGMLDDSIQELRRVAHHMMPESLLRYGLKVSLSDFCSAIPNAEFHYFGDEARLPEKLEIMVYRCIHELVNNALKHADAQRVNVQLIQEAERLSFTVQDDGKGFDQAAVSEGIGLQNIRQRVAAFQGKMDIYSSEKGTEVHIELDLKTDQQHD